MATFDLMLWGGIVVDGTGAPGRRADVGVLDDRIVAIGDLADVAGMGVPTVLDVTDRVVAPGFIDPHGRTSPAPERDRPCHRQRAGGRAGWGRDGCASRPVVAAVLIVMSAALDETLRGTIGG